MASRKFTRKPPSEKEQARRKAWGEAWGKMSTQYKQSREQREANK